MKRHSDTGESLLILECFIVSTQVRRQFGGYGMDAMEHMMSSVADALSNDKSSCSCIEGNPCLSPDCCDNWKDRFKIAHKVRLEKYWNKGRNFDG